MHPTGTFVPPTVIKALADRPGCNMTPAMASAAANLWNWGLYRQRVGKRCELRAYERDSGIPRSTLAGWMKRLEQLGLAEHAGKFWRCTLLEGGPKSEPPVDMEGGPKSEPPVDRDSSQGGPETPSITARNSSLTKNKTLKEGEEEEEGAPRTRKEEVIFQIIRVWNQQKPNNWAKIDDLYGQRLKNLESLGYKGVSGLEKFLDDLPFILRGVKADSWWSAKEMSFSNLTRPTRTHCIDFLEKGKAMASTNSSSNPNRAATFSMGLHPSWDPGPVNRPHELVCTGSFATEEEREASRQEALAHYKLTNPSND